MIFVLPYAPPSNTNPWTAKSPDWHSTTVLSVLDISRATSPSDHIGALSFIKDVSSACRNPHIRSRRQNVPLGWAENCGHQLFLPLPDAITKGKTCWEAVKGAEIDSMALVTPAVSDNRHDRLPKYSPGVIYFQLCSIKEAPFRM
ncbi:hypothetical protein PIIN_10930 [Serendipita indica DSM 11827]|uniref:Uncharacterized protein n=1 Tax=Serendipita indica (strain DSM 11827) TaxID=1109443 RepID=G4U054_SERID|nr:hypothetical protein PIIN_10930 [Serendipita indica DSM 11827]